jgi:hypothetical protein
MEGLEHRVERAEELDPGVTGVADPRKRFDEIGASLLVRSSIAASAVDPAIDTLQNVEEKKRHLRTITAIEIQGSGQAAQQSATALHVEIGQGAERPVLERRVVGESPEKTRPRFATYQRNLRHTILRSRRGL